MTLLEIITRQKR